MEDFGGQRRGTEGKRRQSKLNQEFIVNKKYANLDRGEVENITKQFQRCDTLKNGNIQFNELVSILQSYYQINAKIKEKIFQELEAKSIKKLDLEAVLVLASMLKEFYQNQSQTSTHDIQNEFIDAFVALGGDSDGNGYVQRQTIIDKITNEFELTIDVAQFLEVLELQQDQLDFQAFCQMFEKEERGLSRAGSVLSLLSHRSKNTFNVGLKSQDSFKSLKVRYRDFEKFQAEQEQKEMERNQNTNEHQQYSNEQDEIRSEGSDHSPTKLY